MQMQMKQVDIAEPVDETGDHVTPLKSDTTAYNISSEFSVISSDDEASGAGNSTKISMLEEEENYPEPETLLEELNEILEAFFSIVPDEDIRAYQRFVEELQGQSIAEQALQEPDMAPDFTLQDQDGETIQLSELLKKGPVVLAFYRGKWCPHCNATLMRYRKELVPALKTKYPNVTLVAISPMLPDGTQFLASKRDLNFTVCSDVQNAVADQFRVAFTISEHTRPFMTKWGEHVPSHNGSDEWKIPLPATYVIGQDGRITWSFLDNDPGVRAEVQDILNALTLADRLPEEEAVEEDGVTDRSGRSRRKSILKVFNRKTGYNFLFGKRKKNLDSSSAASLGDDNDSLADSETRSLSSAKTSPAALASQGESIPKNQKNGEKRRSRPKRGQSASEFLGKYLSFG